MGEKCKISIRNIRRDANEELKKLLKSKEMVKMKKNLLKKMFKTSLIIIFKLLMKKFLQKKKK